VANIREKMLINTKVCGFTPFYKKSIEDLTNDYKSILYNNLIYLYHNINNSYSTEENKPTFNYSEYLNKYGNDITYNNKNIEMSFELKGTELKEYILNLYDSEIQQLLYAFENNGPWITGQNESNKTIAGDSLNYSCGKHGINLITHFDINIDKSDNRSKENVVKVLKNYLERDNSNKETDFVRGVKAFFCTYDYYFKMRINIVRIGNQDYSFYDLTY